MMGFEFCDSEGILHGCFCHESIRDIKRIYEIKAMTFTSWEENQHEEEDTVV